MKKILKWLDDNAELYLCVFLMSFMTLVTFIQVVMRKVFNNSLSWSEELTRYIFVWAGFLSVSFCTKRCISIKIEQFVAMFPRRGKAVFKLVNHTFELIFFFYLMPFAVKYLMSAVESGQVSPACHIPMYYVQAAPLVSFLLVSIRIMQRWYIEFQTARKGECGEG